MNKEKAIVLTNGMLDSTFAKTCHGLLRGTDRFDVLAVIDYVHAGGDAGEVMDGKNRGVPVYASVSDYFADSGAQQPVWCVIGVALPGGGLPEAFRKEIIEAMRHKLSIACGLHTLLGDDPEFSKMAEENGVRLLDIRRPRPTKELKFWTGEIFSVKTPIIAVLGIDCAVGKRTTCRFIMEMCRANNIRAEMIFTGQTGWMQGSPYGFIFDSTANDFISGEIERVIVQCDREARPDLILIEGQSALRNPSGPCGSEFILSGNAKGVVLQHVPGRHHYEDTPVPLPPVETEVDLIRMYGAEVIAITLNEEDMSEEDIQSYQRYLHQKLGIPVIRPLKEGVAPLLPAIRAFMEKWAKEQA